MAPRRAAQRVGPQGAGRVAARSGDRPELERRPRRSASRRSSSSARRNGSAGGGRTVMLGRSDQSAAWLERTAVESDAQLLESTSRGWRPARPATDIRSRAPSTSSARTAAGTRAAPRSAGLRGHAGRSDPNEYGVLAHRRARLRREFICFPDGLRHGRGADEVERPDRVRGEPHRASSASAGVRRFHLPPSRRRVRARPRRELDALDALVLERCEGVGRRRGRAFRAPSGLLKVDGAQRARQPSRTPVLVRRRNGRGAGNGRSPTEGSTRSRPASSRPRRSPPRARLAVR